MQQIEETQTEKKVIKIYHSCNPRSGGYSSWLPNRKLVDKIEDADIVWINGGGDWASELYNQKPHPNNWNTGLSQRDIQELEDMKTAVKLGKFIIGTCRGLQGIQILAGGALIQDISHPGSHKIKTFDGNELTTSSLHHQLIDPTSLPEDKCKIIAWAENLSHHHENGDQKEVIIDREPEIVYYPELKGLGWQGHPELQSPDSQMVTYCKELVYDLLEDNLKNKL